MNPMLDPIESDKIRPADKTQWDSGLRIHWWIRQKNLFPYFSTNWYFIPVVEAGQIIRWNSVEFRYTNQSDPTLRIRVSDRNPESYRISSVYKIPVGSRQILIRIRSDPIVRMTLLGFFLKRTLCLLIFFTELNLFVLVY